MPEAPTSASSYKTVRPLDERMEAVRSVVRLDCNLLDEYDIDSIRYIVVKSESALQCNGDVRPGPLRSRLLNDQE